MSYGNRNQIIKDITNIFWCQIMSSTIKHILILFYQRGGKVHLYPLIINHSK